MPWRRGFFFVFKGACDLAGLSAIISKINPFWGGKT